jgi:hypothetical protein
MYTYRYKKNQQDQLYQHLYQLSQLYPSFYRPTLNPKSDGAFNTGHVAGSKEAKSQESLRIPRPRFGVSSPSPGGRKPMGKPWEKPWEKLYMEMAKTSIK